jgi:hypothetical protein
LVAATSTLNKQFKTHSAVKKLNRTRDNRQGRSLASAPSSHKS